MPTSYTTSWDTILVGNLGGIDGDLMEPQQQGQALQSRINFRSLHHAHYLRSIISLLQFGLEWRNGPVREVNHVVIS